MILGNLYFLILFSLIMGFSIYLSWPFLLIKNLNVKISKVLVSLAIGILVFIIADIFSDVSSLIYQSSSIIGNFYISAYFAFFLALMFLILYMIESQRFLKGESDGQWNLRLPLIISIGMGLQNLTEGMILGSSWKIGLISFSIVIIIGFILQNFTEGFPIISPFINRAKPSNGIIALLYFIGGFPTIFGGIFGYFYYGKVAIASIDGAAIGAILFIMMPMFRSLMQNKPDGRDIYLIQFGILLGFLLGLFVNLL